MTAKIVGASFIAAGAIGAVNLPSPGLRLMAMLGLLFGVCLITLWGAEEE